VFFRVSNALRVGAPPAGVGDQRRQGVDGGAAVVIRQ